MHDNDSVHAARQPRNTELLEIEMTGSWSDRHHSQINFYLQ